MSVIKTFNEETGEWEDNTNVEVAQDIIITDPAKGVVLSSEAYQWRITISDAGELVITNLTPP